MVRIRVWLAIIVRLMSDEVMAVIYLETDLSLKWRDAEREMISRIHPAAVQFDLRDTTAAPLICTSLIAADWSFNLLSIDPPPSSSRLFDVYRLFVL